MTLEEKFSKILDNLLVKTENREIRWEPSTSDSFVTSRPDSSIAIEVEGEDYSPQYSMALYDGRGRRLETLRDKDLPGGHEKLDRLYSLARTEALDIEAVADSWLS